MRRIVGEVLDVCGTIMLWLLVLAGGGIVIVGCMTFVILLAEQLLGLP